LNGLVRKAVRSVRLRFYAAISDDLRIDGRPIRNQPVLTSGNGYIRFGTNVRFGVRNSPGFWSTYTYIEARNAEASIEFGDDCWINNGVCIVAEASAISIGRKCLLGHEVVIFDSDFHALSPEGRLSGAQHGGAAVIIEENVFIGSRAVILKGTRIGAGSVVGAGAVVSGEFPARSMIAGNPARIVRSL